MSSHTNKSGDSNSPISSDKAALIPAFIIAAVMVICRLLGVPEFAPVAAPIASVLTGAPIFKRSQEHDLRHGEVSQTTIGLTVALGAAAFLLIDVVAAFFAFGVQQFTEEDPYSTSEAFFFRQEIISLPLKFIGIFLVAAWLAHRLRKSTIKTLDKAVGLYVLLNILGNALIWTSVGGRDFSASDIYLPVFAGAAAWIACRAACRYAGWTQDRFDSTTPHATDLR